MDNEKTLAELSAELQRTMTRDANGAPGPVGPVFRAMAAILQRLIEKENERDAEIARVQAQINRSVGGQMKKNNNELGAFGWAMFWIVVVIGYFLDKWRW